MLNDVITIHSTSISTNTSRLISTPWLRTIYFLPRATHEQQRQQGTSNRLQWQESQPSEEQEVRETEIKIPGSLFKIQCRHSSFNFLSTQGPRALRCKKNIWDCVRAVQVAGPIFVKNCYGEFSMLSLLPWSLESSDRHKSRILLKRLKRSIVHLTKS
jgi:hypothetical protein